MKKLTVTFILSVILLFTLCACGIPAQDNAPVSAAAQQQDIVPVESTALPAAPTPEATKEPEKDLSQFREQAEAIVAAQTELADALEYSIDNDPLTQADYNEKAAQLYEVWDSALNSVWTVLKDALSEDEMNTLTGKQLEWIADKEVAVAAAGADVEGGSMYPLVTNMKAAELTRARVYELLEYLE